MFLNEIVEGSSPIRSAATGVSLPLRTDGFWLLAKRSFAYCGRNEVARWSLESRGLVSGDPRGPKISLRFRLGAAVYELETVEVLAEAHLHKAVQG